MNELTVFNNEEFGEIRTITIDGEPWFVGKDVAEVLGYSNPRKAMIDHVDTEDKGVTKCDTLGGAQEMAIINESGLYSLIISSKLPNAKAFKRWVTADILPAIRKTGGYMTDELLAKCQKDPNVMFAFAEELLNCATKRTRWNQSSMSLSRRRTSTTRLLALINVQGFEIPPKNLVSLSVSSLTF